MNLFLFFCTYTKVAKILNNVRIKGAVRWPFFFGYLGDVGVKFEYYNGELRRSKFWSEM